MILVLAFLPLLTTNASDADPTAVGEILQETSTIQKVLWSVVTTVFGTMVYYAGMLLNAGITDYVVGFGNQFNNIGIGFAVNNLWVIMRDFFNLLFIFGLVYIGFQMILKSGDIQPKKMLVHIILAALLVNFSLFFVKAIVDLSNIAATQVANAFPDGTVDGDIGISDAFLNIFGLQGTFDTGGAAGLEAIAAGGGWAYIIFSMILFIIAAFVFAVGGILLIIRFIVLNLYMILSPVMFLGWVFPAMSSYSQMYWKGFLGRAFFAPAYILMLYFAFVVLDSFSALQGQPQYTDLFKDGATVSQAFGTTLPFFFITAGFLIVAVIVAQKMGADGADYAISLGRSGIQRAKRGTTRVVVGGAKSSFNRTVGYGASMAVNSDRFKKVAANSKLGEYAWRGTRGVASGYEKRQKEKTKSTMQLAKDLGTINTRDENNNRLAETQNKIEDNQKHKDFMKGYNKTQDDIKNNQNNLKQLRNQLEEADDADKSAIQDAITATEKDLKTKQVGFTKLTKEKNELEDRIESTIKFERQIDLTNRKKKEADRFNLKKYVAGGGATGLGAGGAVAYEAGAGAVAGGVMLVAPTAVGAIGVKSLSRDAEKAHKELLKTYGSDGYVAMKKEKNVSAAKIQKQAEKELLDSEDSGEVSKSDNEDNKQTT